MKINVDVKPNSRKESIEKLSDDHYLVRVNAPPVDDKANEAVIDALAEYFKIRRSAITLVQGQKSKKKVFEISGV